MSGGRFNYVDASARNEIFGYFTSDEEPLPNIFEDKEITELIYDVFDLIHDYDWYASGDTSREEYVKSKQKFKNKWLKSKNEERAKRIVDESIENLRKEMYETFCVETKECENSSLTEKKGKWEDIVEMDSGGYPFKVGVCCSACGFETVSEDNYCPCCGAEMGVTESLTEEDYTELRDRFNEYVEFIVRDMISGKGERWE